MANELLGSFDLVFRPSIELITVVRRFVQDFYHHLLDDDGSSQLALATHELLENAAKYSINKEARLSIDVFRIEKGRHVVIRTTNRAGPNDIQNIKELFGEMAEATDPFAFYQTLMRKTARVPNHSGLGIARIAAEADMQVTHELQGDELSVLASCNVVMEDKP